MLFLAEQAFVRRDETRAPLKMPADMGGYMRCKFQKIINSLCKSLTAVASQEKLKTLLTPFDGVGSLSTCAVSKWICRSSAELKEIIHTGQINPW